MADQATIAAYDTFAEAYDAEVVDFWNNFPKDFVARFARATPGRRVLDLGSGSGRDAILLRDRGLDVVCADGSQSMVTMTERLGFESHLCEFSSLPFDDGSFDGVWAYTSLIHIPVEEVAAVLDKLHEMLKPGGTFVFGAIQGESAGRMIARESMPGAERYFRFYESDELRTLVEAHGFVFVVGSTYMPRRKTYIQQLFRRV